MKKNRDVLIGIIVAVVLFGGLVWLARPRPEDSANVGQAAASATVENSYDFGEVSMAQGKVETTFALKNTEARPMTVSKIYTSCMCTEATLVKDGKRSGPYGMPGHGFVPQIGETIAPGEEAEIEVEFDPAAHGPAGVGRIERSIFVETDSAKAIEYRITATVKP